jgi:hypothetical protein
MPGGLTTAKDPSPASYATRPSAMRSALASTGQFILLNLKLISSATTSEWWQRFAFIFFFMICE